LLWVGRSRIESTIRRSESRAGRSSVLLGAGIMLVELPTAFPYFAVIAAVVGSDAGVATQVALLVLFNVLFVAPVLAILALRALTAGRGDRAIELVRAWLHRYAAVLIPALLALLGVGLIVVGGEGLARG
jgi:cytochrome c biogenesis protein CcdA